MPPQTLVTPLQTQHGATLCVVAVGRAVHRERLAPGAKGALQAEAAPATGLTEVLEEVTLVVRAVAVDVGVVLPGIAADMHDAAGAPACGVATHGPVKEVAAKMIDARL